MSKSVSGQDVEDMLSSVRRLVSSELPRNRRASLPEGPDALVLTSEQRIVPAMLGHNSQPKSLEDRIAELEAAVSDTADDWEPDGSEDQDQHQPDRIVYKPSGEDQQGDRPRSLRLSEIALIETGPANDDEIDTSIFNEAAATFRHDVEEKVESSLEPEEMSDEAAASAEEESPAEPDVAQDDVRDVAQEVGEQMRDETIAEVQEIEVVEPATEAPNELLTEDLNSDVEPNEEPVDDIATDEAFEEALAEAVAASLPDAAIDEIERNEDGISIERLEDGVSTERVKEPNGAPDAAQVDEASLHPLVAALIREELQGELGERITRNVRKLVRQEIQRALTVRELE